MGKTNKERAVQLSVEARKCAFCEHFFVIGSQGYCRRYPAYVSKRGDGSEWCGEFLLNEQAQQNPRAFDKEKVRSLLDSYALHCHWMGANGYDFDRIKNEKRGFLHDILTILGIE